jgi:ubiquinone/menaquinone biosynthesis C-methylase UbiE
LRDELYELVLRAGDLRGRRVLDVGCGTGTFAAWLSLHAARVWGVDPSAEMLAVARAKRLPGVGLKQGRAEKLPFTDGWFERAVLMLVLHHLDRPRALAEVRRVLVDGGRLAIATFAPEQFDHYYLGRFFPSIASVDRARFGRYDELAGQLAEAGFHGIACERLEQHAEASRETIVERVRGRHISTFQLIPEDEYLAGLERLERELPERVESQRYWLVVVAST